MIFFNRQSPWWTISCEVETYDQKIQNTKERIIHAQNAVIRWQWYERRYQAYRLTAIHEMIQRQTWEDDGGPTW